VGTIFGQGGGSKNGKAKVMGSLSNLDRVFIPEISSSLKKEVFAGLGPRSCPRSKCSLKKNKGLRRLPTAFVWLRIQFSGGAQIAQGGGAKIFPGGQLPPTSRIYGLDYFCTGVKVEAQ